LKIFNHSTYFFKLSKNKTNINTSYLYVTQMFFLGFTKMLVGHGFWQYGITNNFEVIDLSMPSSVCQDLPNFPYSGFGSVGELMQQDHPLICGGFGNNQCYSYKDGSWQEELSLAENRGYASSAPSPFPNNPFSMMISGGSNPSTSSVVYFSEETWKELPDLPTQLTDHCMVKVSSSIVMVIGGIQDEEVSKKTFLLDTKENVWKNGPSLQQERGYLSCGLIRSAKNSSEFSIIAVGGRLNDGPRFSTTEVLDQPNGEWRQGPTLPFGINHAQLVEDADGGVILVGGYADDMSDLDILLRLPHAGQDGEWEELPQKLTIGRGHHTAVMVPDNLANCN
jgi:hypothetical protein